MALLQARGRALVVTVMRLGHSISWRGLIHQRTCLQAAWGAVFDALIRHGFVCEHSAVFSRVPLLAEAHAVTAVAVVVARVEARAPGAALAGPSIVARTLIPEAATMTTASCHAMCFA